MYITNKQRNKMKVTNKKLIIQAYIAFSKFVVNNNIYALLTQLENIESTLKGKRNTTKGLWFRFNCNDSLATTLYELNYIISSENKENKGFFTSLIGEALNHQTLELFYS